MKVGMIGLGNMGMPMAERLLDKFGDLMVYNRTASKCAPLCEKGAVQAKSAGDLAAKCDVVVMSLAGPAAVSAVMKEVLSDGQFNTVSLEEIHTVRFKNQRDHWEFIFQKDLML